VEVTDRTYYRPYGQSFAPEGHASMEFAFEALKENTNGNGVITINRQDPEPKAVNGEETSKLTAAING
jgi:hypothetical protein